MENKETRIAVIGIIVENTEQAEKVNALLHEYSQYIIGRMGLPYGKKKVSIISVVMDAPMDTISALSGKLGSIPQVSSKALYSKEMNHERNKSRPACSGPALRGPAAGLSCAFGPAGGRGNALS